MSNAFQWRLPYSRVVGLTAEVKGITKFGGQSELMNFNRVEIPRVAVAFFRENQAHMRALESGNALLEEICGIEAFFDSTELAHAI